MYMYSKLIKIKIQFFDNVGNVTRVSDSLKGLQFSDMTSILNFSVIVGQLFTRSTSKYMYICTYVYVAGVGGAAGGQREGDVIDVVVHGRGVRQRDLNVRLSRHLKLTLKQHIVIPFRIMIRFICKFSNRFITKCMK